MNPNLPAFNPNVSCPKCGFSGDYLRNNEIAITCRYHKEEVFAYGHLEPCWNKVPEGIEHIHRHCTRCHYEWVEACIPQHKEKENHA